MNNTWLDDFADTLDWWHGDMTLVGKVIFIPVVLFILTVFNLIRWFVMAVIGIFFTVLVLAMRVFVRYSLREVLGGLFDWVFDLMFKKISEA